MCKNKKKSLLIVMYFYLILQIKPLVEPTNIIVDLPSLTYSWHDFISKSKYIILLFDFGLVG